MRSYTCLDLGPLFNLCISIALSLVRYQGDQTRIRGAVGRSFPRQDTEIRQDNNLQYSRAWSLGLGLLLSLIRSASKRLAKWVELGRMFAEEIR